MIVRTKWFSGGSKGALNLLRYIERGMHANRIFTVPYYGYRPLTEQDIEEIKELVDSGTNAFRHVIIAPQKQYDELEFHFKVLEAMDTWIRRTGRYGVHYYWGLHYNTTHPHAHIGMVAPFREDISMTKDQIKRYVSLIEEVFGEKYTREKELEEEIEQDLNGVEVEFEYE